MTAYAVGDRVRVVSPVFPKVAATVTDPAYALPSMTVLVRSDRDGKTYPFRPDELELINDNPDAIRPEPVPDAGIGQGISGSEVAAGVAAE